MNEDAELLRRYAAGHSETAFTELIRRHVDLVYSAALRLVGGDVHRAQDVTQQVFTELARQAKRLTKHPALAGWLYTTTRLIAYRTNRTELRRKAREQEATAMNELLRETAPESDWERLRPVLDDAMHELDEKDRHAVLLRFFKNKSLKEVGAALDLNENAARMRVERALEKLRLELARKGVTSTVAALALTLTGNAVTAAPAGFVTTLAGASLKGAAAATGTTLTLLKIMTMTKLKAGIISAIIVAGVATPLVIQQRQAQVRLRDENEILRQQVGRIEAMEVENQRLSNEVVQVRNSQSLPSDQLNELLRLRGELASSRNDSLARSNAAQMQDPAYRAGLLKQRLEQMPDKKIPELQLLHDQDWLSVAGLSHKLETEDDFGWYFAQLRKRAKQQFAELVGQAFHKFARANSGQLPSDFSQLKPYLSGAVDDAMLQRYDLKQSGRLSEVRQLGPYGTPGRGTPDTVRTEPLALERAPVDEKYDTQLSIEAYGCSFLKVGTGIGTGSVSWKVKREADGTLEPAFPFPDERTNQIPSIVGDSGPKADPTGTWTWTNFRFSGSGNSGGGGSIKITLELKAEDGKLTGSLSDPGFGSTGATATAISEGAMEGNKISFDVVEGGRFGTPITNKFAGTISGDTINGSDYGGLREWVATRVK